MCFQAPSLDRAVVCRRPYHWDGPSDDGNVFGMLEWSWKSYGENEIPDAREIQTWILYIYIDPLEERKKVVECYCIIVSVILIVIVLIYI